MRRRPFVRVLRALLHDIAIELELVRYVFIRIVRIAELNVALNMTFLADESPAYAAFLDIALQMECMLRSLRHVKSALQLVSSRLLQIDLEFGTWLIGIGSERKERVRYTYRHR